MNRKQRKITFAPPEPGQPLYVVRFPETDTYYPDYYPDYYPAPSKGVPLAQATRMTKKAAESTANFYSYRWKKPAIMESLEDAMKRPVVEHPVYQPEKDGGGVTLTSTENLRKHLNLLGDIEKVTMLYDPDGREWYTTTFHGKAADLVVTGFSAGYSGEGSRGLLSALDTIGFPADERMKRAVYTVVLDRKKTIRILPNGTFGVVNGDYP